MKKENTVTVDYTDYKGHRNTRHILPVNLTFGKLGKGEPEYMIVAVDLDSDQVRTFAVKDIHSWKNS